MVGGGGWGVFSLEIFYVYKNELRFYIFFGGNAFGGKDVGNFCGANKAKI